MTHLTAIDHADPYRWNTVFAVLSLDLTIPFLSDMGLTMERADEFRAGLRKHIEVFRLREAMQGNVEQQFLRQVFGWSTQEFGQPFTNRLFAWGEHVFQSGSGNVNAFLWNNIVRRGGLNGEKDVHPPPQFITVLRAKLAKRKKAALHRLTPVTPWDKQVYERQQYDRYRNAMELAQATVNYHDFVSAWEETLSEAGPIDRGEIGKWAKREASILGMPEERVGDPGDWTR